MAETTTSFSSDQLNQQIELILDAYGIAPQNGDAKLYDKITALIDTPQKKQQFFDEMVTYKTAQPNLANYQDLYNDALDFSRKQPGNYNKGTYSSTISLVNREKAAGLDSSFLDVYHICNQPEASRTAEVKKELAKQSHRRLLTGALEKVWEARRICLSEKSKKRKKSDTGVCFCFGSETEPCFAAAPERGCFPVFMNLFAPKRSPIIRPRFLRESAFPRFALRRWGKPGTFSLISSGKWKVMKPSSRKAMKTDSPKIAFWFRVPRSTGTMLFPARLMPTDLSFKINIPPFFAQVR